MRRISAPITMSLASAIVVTGLAFVPGSVQAAPAPAAAASSSVQAPLQSEERMQVTSAKSRASVPRRGQWEKVYPPNDYCPEKVEMGCAFEEEDMPRPWLPDKVSPLGDVKFDDGIMSSERMATAQVQPRGSTWFLKKVTDTTGGNGVPLDTSVAAKDKKIVYVQNRTISVSVDSGATFSTPRDVSTMYADSPNGGVCCDMIVNYVPSINRFVWVTQYWAGSDGRNRYRLAVFPPSAVTATGITSWTYWDITAAHMPGTQPFLDFPELSFGSQYLYLGFHHGPAFCGCVTNGSIARIGLVNLRDGLNLAAGATAWRYYIGGWDIGTVAQNTGTRAYWGRTTSTATFNIGWWDESSIYLYPTHSITTYTWPNADYVSKVGSDQWLHTYTGMALAAARSGDNLYFAWTAGRGTGNLEWLKQPHIQLLTIGGANSGSLSLAGQRALWNPDYAIAYPNLNVMGSHLGITFAYGGGSTYPNSGFMDVTETPYTFYGFTNGTASCNCGRWGDYAAIRPWIVAAEKDQVATRFIASGYDVRSVSATGGATLRQVGSVAALTSP